MKAIQKRLKKSDEVKSSVEVEEIYASVVTRWQNNVLYLLVAPGVAGCKASSKKATTIFMVDAADAAQDWERYQHVFAVKYAKGYRTAANCAKGLSDRFDSLGLKVWKKAEKFAVADLPLDEKGHKSTAVEELLSKSWGLVNVSRLSPKAINAKYGTNFTCYIDLLDEKTLQGYEVKDPLGIL